MLRRYNAAMNSARSLIILVCVLVLAAMSGAYYFHINRNGAGDQSETFTTACITPTLAGDENIGEACRSQKTIKDTYNLDVKARIDAQHKKMKETAKRIASGEMQDPQLYKACIRRDECAEVPLLAADVDSAKMTAAQEHASTAFWDLAEKDKMTEPVCDLIPECQAMVKLGVIDYGFKPQE